MKGKGLIEVVQSCSRRWLTGFWRMCKIEFYINSGAAYVCHRVMYAAAYVCHNVNGSWGPLEVVKGK